MLIDLHDRGFERYRLGVLKKLLPAKFAKIKFRQDALQTTLSVFLDIFHPLPSPQIWASLRRMDFFNSHACHCRALRTREIS
jgi:hypothetical protein